MYLCRHSVHATSSRSVHAARYVPGDAGNFAVSSPHVSHVTAGIIPRLFELVDKTLEQCLFRQQYTAAPPVYVCTRDGTHACARALIITFISLQFFSSAGNSRRDYTYIDRARDPACLPPPPLLLLLHFIPLTTLSFRGMRFIILPHPTVRFAVAIRNGNLSNVSHN